MHPGNILVRKKASRGGLFKTKKPHIVFLDVGMTAELSKNDRENLLDFFKAVARRDGRTAAERTLKLSRKQNCPNPEAFIEVIIYLLQGPLYLRKIVELSNIWKISFKILYFVMANTFIL